MQRKWEEIRGNFQGESLHLKNITTLFPKSFGREEDALAEEDDALDAAVGHGRRRGGGGALSDCKQTSGRCKRAKAPL